MLFSMLIDSSFSQSLHFGQDVGSILISSINWKKKLDLKKNSEKS